METDHTELLFTKNNANTSSYCFLTILQTGNCPWAFSENSGIKRRDHFRKILEIIAKKGPCKEGRIAALMLFLPFLTKKEKGSRQNGAAQEELIIATKQCCLLLC